MGEKVKPSPFTLLGFRYEVYDMARYERHISIPFRVFESSKYSALSPCSKDILHIFISRYYPKQPQRAISLSYGEILEMRRYARTTISRSLRELQDVGYIKLKHKGSYRNDASEYTLNPELTLRKKGD